MSRRTSSSNSIRSREQQFRLSPPPGSSSSLPSVPCAVGNYGKSTTAVIVTHPFGPLGGNMHNNVVLAAVLYFQRILGWTTCRFDFLPHSFLWQTGSLQVQQVQQVAQLLLDGGNEETTLEQRSILTDDNNNSQFPQKPTQVILVGYSYGSLIAACASAKIPQCVASISIAPAFGVATWLLSFRSEHFLAQAALRSDLYRLFIIGDEDNFTSESYFQSTVEKRFPQTDDDNMTQAAILKGADHFFRHREKDLMAIIGQWLQDVFGPNVLNDPFCELVIHEGVPSATTT